uniref:Uncharacterized protein n=1 Tax=Aegilops tauschii subsp. strangulata TaxID=200361 RepID=A0A453QT27_AEGTS
TIDHITILEHTQKLKREGRPRPLHHQDGHIQIKQI